LRQKTEPVQGVDAVVLTGEGATDGEAARKRAAVEVVARYEAVLRRTARRFSLCADDADDAYQRALEILLTKAPTIDSRELIRWMQTVTKHEALALRRERERLLGRGARRADDGEAVDWVALLPADDDGPDEQVERREAISHSREALKALRPAELRALSLLAEGYSYAEIGRITKFSHSKVNRSIAEGRERFRSFLSRSEDGSLCRELRPLLSAFCDGETSSEEAAEMREHLRACAACRATMRAYRSTPGAVAALLPLPGIPAGGSLLGRFRNLLGGAKGTGMAKGLAICASAAGGAACVVTGVVPGPFVDAPAGAKRPAIERSGGAAGEARAQARTEARKPRPIPPTGERRRTAADPDPTASEAAVEYAPPPPPPPEPALEPEPAPEPVSEAAPSSSGDAAGEFGP
jgi:RNA polymerase sigma factor (sigma-70 family)